jgi:hypothetical protein
LATNQACWIFGECFDIKYENQATFLHGLQQVLNLTKDSDLPVRLKAAVSLRFLCQNELSYQPLHSVLPHLLESASTPSTRFTFFSFSRVRVRGLSLTVCAHDTTRHDTQCTLR